MQKKLIVLYIFIVGFIGLNAIISLIRPELQARIIDDLSNPININTTTFMTLLIFFWGILLLSYFVSYIQRLIISFISEEIAADIRQKIHDKLATVRIDFLVKLN